MVKMFAKHLTHDELVKACDEMGYTLDDAMYRETGSDHVVVTGMFAGKLMSVVYNSLSGRFLGTPPSGNADDIYSSDDELDGEPWFDELLAFFYSQNQELVK